MRFHADSYNKAYQQEVFYLPHLKQILNDDSLTHTKGKLATFDFIGKNKFVELKARNCEYKKYSDTMIGMNKIEFAKANPDKECYFCFLFTDGLYYWKYNEDDKLNYRSGGRFDRGYNEIKQYAYIPINLLKNISIDTIDEPEKILL